MDNNDDSKFKKKTPYQIHLDLMENYKKYKENAHKLVKTDKDVLKEEYRYINIILFKLTSIYTTFFKIY